LTLELPQRGYDVSTCLKVGQKSDHISRDSNIPEIPGGTLKRFISENIWNRGGFLCQYIMLGCVRNSDWAMDIFWGCLYEDFGGPGGNINTKIKVILWCYYRLDAGQGMVQKL